jgi:hypothetical protein
MIFALFGIASILICWKWGNWKNWKEYYPTILFFFVSNLVYCVLIAPKPLWNYGPWLGQYPFFDITVMLSLYPSTTILFFTFYPFAAQLGKQALYILLWTAIYTAMELLASVTGGFSYSNGWNIYYSVLFNLLMFPLLRLHYKKPLLAWPLSMVLSSTLVFWFQIPLSR